MDQIKKNRQRRLSTIEVLEGIFWDKQQDIKYCLQSRQEERQVNQILPIKFVYPWIRIGYALRATITYKILYLVAMKAIFFKTIKIPKILYFSS